MSERSSDSTSPSSPDVNTDAKEMKFSLQSTTSQWHVNYVWRLTRRLLSDYSSREQRRQHRSVSDEQSRSAILQAVHKLKSRRNYSNYRDGYGQTPHYYQTLTETVIVWWYGTQSYHGWLWGRSTGVLNWRSYHNLPLWRAAGFFFWIRGHLEEIETIFAFSHDWTEANRKQCFSQMLCISAQLSGFSQHDSVRLLGDGHQHDPSRRLCQNIIKQKCSYGICFMWVHVQYVPREHDTEFQPY